MSVEAISWALKQHVEHSSAKFVLVVMANCAGNDALCYPSIAYLAESTGQDRKTVLANIERLKAAGYIADSGERKGRTGQIIVYRITDPAKRNSPKNGTVQSGAHNGTEIGTVEQSQNRDGSTDETVPFSPSNSTEIPGKESRFSHVTVPKTGHGTIKETTKEPSKKKARASAPPFVRPEWIDADLWEAFLDMRKRKRAVNSDYALKLIVGELEKLRVAGDDPIASLKQSVQSSWVDVYPVRDKTKSVARAATAGPPWWSTEAGVIAKGKEVGLNPRPGETMPEFKGRVSVAIEAEHKAVA